MSTAVSFHPPETDLYDEDFYAWTTKTAFLLRENRFSEIDIAHLAEELEDMGKRERRSLKSHIRNVILHLLKWQYQSDKRSPSWRQSIRNGRIEIHELLHDSPSLANLVDQILDDDYPAAQADAVDETGLDENTFPVQCPFTVEASTDHGIFAGIETTTEEKTKEWQKIQVREAGGLK
jgi:hypothetical protein